MCKKRKENLSQNEINKTCARRNTCCTQSYIHTLDQMNVIYVIIKSINVYSMWYRRKEHGIGEKKNDWLTKTILNFNWNESIKMSSC